MEELGECTFQPLVRDRAGVGGWRQCVLHCAALVLNTVLYLWFEMTRRYVLQVESLWGWLDKFRSQDILGLSS